MSESAELRVGREYSITEFKQNTKTFVYTWKITNFREMCKEDANVDTVTSSSCSSSDSEKKEATWRVKLYLKGKSETWFYVDIDNFPRVERVAYGYYILKILFVGKIEETLARDTYTFTGLMPVCFCLNNISKVSLLSETSKYLPNDELTLKFCLTYTKNEFLHSKPNSANSNMLPFTPLESMFDNEKLSDIKIAIVDKVFHAHKVILAAGSPVFSAMFEHDMKEKFENVVEIKDVDEKIMQEALYFMYTGKVRNIEDVAFDLLGVADKYEMEVLQLMCENALIEQLKVENVIQLLVLAEKVGAKRLKENALLYFKLHGKEIVETEVFKKELDSFMHLLPDICKSLVA